MFQIIKYPDGQVNVKCSRFIDKFLFRVNSYEDLFVLKSIADIKNNIDVYIPCLFGQRSDRRFQENESFGLKIICDFINSCNFKTVTILDPHSDVGPALINNCKIKTSEFFVKKVIEKLTNPVLISPDAGAYKKIFKYSEKFNLPLVAANKFRDLKGNITLNILGEVKDKECLIVDDLADGGYTFYLLAKQLKELGANKVYLYVTHAYFNKGFDLLKEYIDHIYCTNSVKEIQDNFVTQFNVDYSDE